MSQSFRGPYDDTGPASPGAFQQTGQGGRPVLPRRRRRGLHISTVMTLLLGLPWLLVSLVVVMMLVTLLGGSETTVSVVCTAFLASGALVFLRPTEELIARVLFRLRTPNSQEATRLDVIWGTVAQAAGVKPTKFRLRIQESDGINAIATAGHIIAVTRAAANSLPPNHLAGVLAHELGHHLGGHAWARLLTYWYSLPGRVLVRVWFLFSYVTFGILTLVTAGTAMSVGGRTTVTVARLLVWPILRLFPIMVVLLLVWMLYTVHPTALLALLLPVVLAWFNRLGEKHADKVAAQLGFGPALLEVLHGWVNAGHDTDRAKAGWRRLVLATHPSCASRIRTLEKRLYGRSVA